jgi:hypothetical protein
VLALASCATIGGVKRTVWMRAACASGQLGSRLACAYCACLILSCSPSKVPAPAAEAAVKEALPKLPVDDERAEPEPNEGLDQLAEPALPEQEEMNRVTSSSLPPAVVLKANELALRMLKDVEPARANLILAPITTLLALEMTLPGARGKTAQELERSLGLSGPQAQLVAKELKGLAASPGAGNKLQLASGLYTDEGLTVQASFERELRESFHASRLSVPFAKNPEAARTRINQPSTPEIGCRSCSRQARWTPSPARCCSVPWPWSPSGSRPSIPREPSPGPSSGEVNPAWKCRSWRERAASRWACWAKTPRYSSFPTVGTTYRW